MAALFMVDPHLAGPAEGLKWHLWKGLLPRWLEQGMRLYYNGPFT